jgi:hypothetical protein
VRPECLPLLRGDTTRCRRTVRFRAAGMWAGDSSCTRRYGLRLAQARDAAIAPPRRGLCWCMFARQHRIAERQACDSALALWQRACDAILALKLLASAISLTTALSDSPMASIHGNSEVIWITSGYADNTSRTLSPFQVVGHFQFLPSV